jgi:hypothetical protein
MCNNASGIGYNFSGMEDGGQTPQQIDPPPITVIWQNKEATGRLAVHSRSIAQKIEDSS